MKYISTRGSAPTLGFEDAMLSSLASDGGLYVPQEWVQLDKAVIASFCDKSYEAVAVEVLTPFMGDSVLAQRLPDFVAQAYATFSTPEVAPLAQLTDQIHLLELYHGPSLAFKDVAMQLLARLMDDALIRRGARASIIGATSGDTGGAAIAAFRGREAVDIFILYPDGRVSDVQRRQMTSVSDAHVHAIAIDGTFDDCQSLVKAAFNDSAFRTQCALSGVNSINWARVMAQIVYYFTAAAQLGAPDRQVAFSVPTGNFGDIFAGYAAARMGLPIAQLMIATNVNDILARTLQSGRYALGAVTATHSPSMDIQVSSNFERLLFEVSNRDAAKVCAYMNALTQEGAFDIDEAALATMRQIFAAARIDERETLAIMQEVKATHGLEIDPHSAVGVGAAQKMDLAADIPIISLATAHPAKFPQAVAAAYGALDNTPASITALADKQERITHLPNNIEAVQDFVRTHKR
ncbi:MAG: threonine synthase [Alphaproteobacteria bacterium]|nr:threonine synthase [Alphaproteobacteria bacterium]